MLPFRYAAKLYQLITLYNRHKQSTFISYKGVNNVALLLNPFHDLRKIQFRNKFQFLNVHESMNVVDSVQRK